MTTIADLNNDCLAHILRYFTVKEYDHLRLVSPQFESAVLTCWPSKTRKWCRILSTSKRDFEWIMTNIAAFVEYMDFNFLEDNELRYLKASGQVYRTKRLRAIVDNRKRRSTPLGPDISSRTLVKSFPQLTVLSLEGNVDCEVLSQLEGLKELHLFFQNCTIVQRFERLFSVLKLRKISIGYETTEPLNYIKEDFKTIIRCESLEEIALNAELLEIILPLNNQFPNLRKIASFDLLERESWNPMGKKVYTKIVEVLGPRVHTLKFDQLVHHSHKDFTRLENLFLHKFENLHTLKIKNIKMSLSIFSPQQMRIDFSKLRELHFLMYPSYSAYNQFDLLTSISTASKLQVLVVPNEWVDTVFELPDLLELLEKQLGRKVPLELRLLDRYNSFQERHMRWESDNENLLRITYDIFPKHEHSMHYNNQLRFAAILYDQ